MQQELIAGRYRLLDLVGTGGMGRVWLARDEMLHRDVAVKEIVPPTWLDRRRARRAARCARCARPAPPPGSTTPTWSASTTWCTTGASPWIVMEYVRPGRCSRSSATDGPLRPRGRPRIGLEVLAALRAAHAAGVLHRDVKPHNVLVGRRRPGGAHRLRAGHLRRRRRRDDRSGHGARLAAVRRPRAGPRRSVRRPRPTCGRSGATLYAAVEGRSPYARASAMATLSALATEPPDPMRRAGPLRPVLDRSAASRAGSTADRRRGGVVAARGARPRRPPGPGTDRPPSVGPGGGSPPRRTGTGAAPSAASPGRHPGGRRLRPGRRTSARPAAGAGRSGRRLEGVRPTGATHRCRRRVRAAVGGGSPWSRRPSRARCWPGSASSPCATVPTPPSSPGGGAGDPVARPAAFACGAPATGRRHPGPVRAAPPGVSSSGWSRGGPGTRIRPGSGSPRRPVGCAGPRAG